MELETRTLMLLVLRDDAPRLDEHAAAELQDAHLDHLATLHEQGQLLAAGPVEDPEGRVRGLVIFAADPERALRLAAADPAVAAGRLEPRIMPWHVPAGAMHFTKTRFPHSVADLGT